MIAIVPVLFIWFNGHLVQPVEIRTSEPVVGCVAYQYTQSWGHMAHTEFTCYTKEGKSIQRSKSGVFGI
jgi:hypothetical protein